MFRYRLRTLLILLAIGPPLLAVAWREYAVYRARVELKQAVRDLKEILEAEGEIRRRRIPPHARLARLAATEPASSPEPVVMAPDSQGK
jgi:hypothetical protein